MTRAEKALAIWTEKAGRIFDEITAAIQDDAGKLVTIAGIMPMQCDPAYFTPDAPKA